MQVIIGRILDHGLLAEYWPIVVAGARISIYRHERSSTKSTVLEYDGPAPRLTQQTRQSKQGYNRQTPE